MFQSPSLGDKLLQDVAASNDSHHHAVTCRGSGLSQAAPTGLSYGCSVTGAGLEPSQSGVPCLAVDIGHQRSLGRPYVASARGLGLLPSRWLRLERELPGEMARLCGLCDPAWGRRGPGAGLHRLWERIVPVRVHCIMLALARDVRHGRACPAVGTSLSFRDPLVNHSPAHHCSDVTPSPPLQPQAPRGQGRTHRPLLPQRARQWRLESGACGMGGGYVAILENMMGACLLIRRMGRYSGISRVVQRMQ